mmetsp:Transcript_54962/g.119877  ORF Transcript_54962/g.119877 Transcript_54962/m.119877 type:complete len:335 (+) Transcript_54962:379-1383(+)
MAPSVGPLKATSTAPRFALTSAAWWQCRNALCVGEPDGGIGDLAVGLWRLAGERRPKGGLHVVRRSGDAERCSGPDGRLGHDGAVGQLVVGVGVGVPGERDGESVGGAPFRADAAVARARAVVVAGDELGEGNNRRCVPPLGLACKEERGGEPVDEAGEGGVAHCGRASLEVGDGYRHRLARARGQRVKHRRVVGLCDHARDDVPRERVEEDVPLCVARCAQVDAAAARTSRRTVGQRARPLDKLNVLVLRVAERRRVERVGAWRERVGERVLGTRAVHAVEEHLPVVHIVRPAAVVRAHHVEGRDLAQQRRVVAQRDRDVGRRSGHHDRHLGR